MLSKRTTTRLEEMKGKTFIYGGKIHCILEFTDNGTEEEVTVKTNIKNFKRSYDSIIPFLDEFQPYDQPVSVLPAVVDNTDKEVEASVSRADKMIALLEDNIVKVQADPTYIPQATCINNNVNAIINIEKMRFQAISQRRKKN